MATGTAGEESGGSSFFAVAPQSAISLMKWSITREKPPRRAVSGSIGTDAFASGSFGYMTLPISLVKSDWKPSKKTGASHSLPRLFRSPFCFRLPGRFWKLISVFPPVYPTLCIICANISTSFSKSSKVG